MKPAGWRARVFVAVDVLCPCCHGRGKRRVMARFGRSTYPGADPAMWQQAWREGPVNPATGRRAGPLLHSLWSGEDGGTAQLQCRPCWRGCEKCHGGPWRMTEARIVAELDRVPVNPDGPSVSALVHR